MVVGNRLKNKYWTMFAGWLVAQADGRHAHTSLPESSKE
jgi:hypothetical protein